MLIEHLAAFYDVGEHNHIRLRGADWNGALDMARDRGESVAFTAVFGSNLEQMADLILKLEEKGIKKLSFFKEIELLLADNTNLYEDIAGKNELLRKYGDTCRHTLSGEQVEILAADLAKNLQNKAQWIKNHIKATEWLTNKEGYSWYNSYYDNSGWQ
jgi:hypothetical protein